MKFWARRLNENILTQSHSQAWWQHRLPLGPCHSAPVHKYLLNVSSSRLPSQSRRSLNFLTEWATFSQKAICPITSTFATCRSLKTHSFLERPHFLLKVIRLLFLVHFLSGRRVGGVQSCASQGMHRILLLSCSYNCLHLKSYWKWTAPSQNLFLNREGPRFVEIILYHCSSFPNLVSSQCAGSTLEDKRLEKSNSNHFHIISTMQIE